MRAAKRLLSARRCATRAKVSSLMIAGTGISIHSSLGRSTVLDGAWGGAALQAGDPVHGRGFVHDHRLAEHRASGVGGVAQHRPDHAAVPAVFSGAGGHARVGQPAGQLGDGGAVVGVAAEGTAGVDRVIPAFIADDADRDLVAGVGIEVVLCYAPDRLARKFAYQALLIEEFTRAGTRGVRQGPARRLPEDQLLVQFQGMFAEYEKAQILERYRRGKTPSRLACRTHTVR